MDTKRTVLDQGIIVAGISTFVYFVAFVYELGYNKYYSIPTEFISVGLESIFITLIGIASLLWTLYFIIEIFRHFLVGAKNRVIRKVWLYALVFLLILTPWLLTGNQVNWKIVLVWVAPLLLVEFIFPLRFRNEESYEKKFEKQQKIDDVFGEFLFEKFLDCYIGKWGGIVMIMILYIVWVSYIGGGYSARIQTEFMAATINGQENILLKRDGEQLVFSPLFDSNRIEKKFYTIPRSNLSDTMFRIIKIPSLNVEK